MDISIHAPRGGSDVRALLLTLGHHDFNPRSPWGERLLKGSVHIAIAIFQSTLPVGGATRTSSAGSLNEGFQSTLPVGGATLRRADTIRCMQISIHAPRGGSDWDNGSLADLLQDFNPRSPWGERQSSCSRSGSRS